MRTAKLKPGQSVEVHAEGGRIIVEPVLTQFFRLEDLVAAITKGNRHDLI
jgi:antitoxin component of MazEF toxin-antitoxin module